MADTQRLCRLNLAVHGLSGDIREASSFYDAPFKPIGRFDYVMANPPFNQSEVDRARLVSETGKVDARFPFGLPTVNNANHLCISLFYSALNATGRAGFVMANSAGDAGGSEKAMRQKLIETGAVDCIIATSPNMFFTVTLPVTLWFLDKANAKGPNADKVLFIDARHIFEPATRAHRVFRPEQIEFLGNIVRLWRGERWRVGLRPADQARTEVDQGAGDLERQGRGGLGFRIATLWGGPARRRNLIWAQGGPSSPFGGHRRDGIRAPRPGRSWRSPLQALDSGAWKPNSRTI